ncbi:hypothetical protein C6502_05135 [Candidatus Poribacteria bacterium]|nr:MAG: hypothetical protein C6502_05135 [Candidatus Poribacteria bacterium]
MKKWRCGAFIRVHGFIQGVWSKQSVLRFTHHVLRMTLYVLLGVSTAHGWIDGTPYFYEHFGPVLKDTSEVPSAPARPNAPQLILGDRKEFFAVNFNTHEQYIVQSTLRAIGEFCYIFVEDSEWLRTVNEETVRSVRRAFDDATPADSNRGIYEIETELFGAPPDIDGDKRIYLLLLDIRDKATRGSNFVAGFFSPINQHRGVLRHPELGIPVRSNELDMLYLDTDPLNAGSEKALGVLAHELEHLIHWRHDSNEEIWINEGCAEYAMFICGYRVTGHVSSFQQNPRISLIDWPQGARSQLAHYGAVYLWMLYLHEHYGGSQTIAAIVKDRANGISGINNALHSRGVEATFPVIYADWKVANYLDDTEFADGRYGYQNEQLRLRPHREHRSYPVSVENNVLASYASDYIPFYPSARNGNLSLSFEGDNRLPYDVKAIEFQGEQPTTVHDISLTEMGKGSLLILAFGQDVGKVTLIPSIQSEQDLSGRNVSSYAYSAQQIIEKVEFNATVLPNPIHPRYWDIIAVPNHSIAGSPPQITVAHNAKPIISAAPMKVVQDGAIYTYSLHLSPEITPERVRWEIFFLGESVGSGELQKR